MRAITVFLILLSPLLCLADGKFIPLGKLTKTSIPYQRAIVSYKGQTETLVVESVLNAPAGDYAWIVPVPSTPKVEAVTSGTLETMWQLVQPSVKMNDNLGLVGVLTAIVIILVYILLSKGGLRRMLEWLLVFLILATLGAVLFPVFASAGSTPTLNISVADYGRIGSYDVKVIKGTSAAGVQAWLTQHGGTLPREAEAAVEAYAKEGWLFVVARLAKAKDGPLIPHPLKLTFETPKPVYPMRLTGVGAEDLQLDLYVIGDKQAEVGDLRLWGCRKLEKNKVSAFGDGLVSDTGFVYGARYEAVGHPELLRMMWPSCWVTHLHGTLSPEQMKSDVPIEWKQPVEYVHTVYAQEAATRTGIEKGLILFMVGFLGATIAAKFVSSNPKSVVAKSTIWLMMASAIFATVWRFTLERVEAQEGDRNARANSNSHQLVRSADEVSRVVATSAEALKLLKDHKYAYSYGEKLTEGDVPYGYTFKTKGQDTFMTVYDWRAVPYTTKLQGDQE